MNREYDSRVEKVKLKELWPTIKRLFAYLKATKFLLGLAAIAAIAGTLMQVVTPKMLGKATNTIFEGFKEQQGIDFNQLFQVLLVVASLMFGAFIASFIQQRIMLTIAQKITFKLRNELKEKMNRLPISYFDKNPNGKLMSIAVNDIENIVNTLQSSLTEFISSVITLVGVIGFMLAISWQLSLIAALLIPGSLLVMKILSPKTQAYNKSYMQHQGDLNTKIEETYQGFSVIKSFNQEESEVEQFNQINQGMYDTGWKAQVFGGSMMPVMITVQNFVYVLLAVFGGIKVMSGAISIGDMQAFLQYSGQFSQPLAQSGQIWNNILSAAAAAERVFTVLDEKEEVHYQETFPNEGKSASKVQFKDVTFGYDETPLMKDFNLNVTSGETIAIVGHTGAGKSTLINLLERFYEIQGGSIQIDGEDIRNKEAGQIRKQLGMVLQDTWLFSGTIYENLRYGKPEATEAEIYRAAKAAYADDFIQKLPEGYQTVLNEDASNISQGQKQLLTIARAFLSDPEILILDEATSNVDSRTELIIQQAMKKLMVNRTSFVVAHRLSTIYDADRILVMNQGAIVESGKHAELLTLEGEYASIYESQFSQKTA